MRFSFLYPAWGSISGGLEKEYAVDRVIEILKSCGVENAMVNFGGDIHALGCPKKPSIGSSGSKTQKSQVGQLLLWSSKAWR